MTSVPFKSRLRPEIRSSIDSSERLYSLAPVNWYSSNGTNYWRFGNSEEDSFRDLETPGCITAMTPAECLSELQLRYPAANSGCNRVFLYRHPGFTPTPPEEHRLSSDIHIYHTHLFPYATHVVVFPTDIYCGSDLYEFSQLVHRCGTFPCINENILRNNTDPNLMRSRGKFHPGAIPCYLYDKDGRIKRRRDGHALRKNGLTYELYNDPKQLEKLFTLACSDIRQEARRIQDIRDKRRVRQKNRSFFILEELNPTNESTFNKARDDSRSFERITTSIKIDRNFLNTSSHLNLDLAINRFNPAVMEMMRRSSSWPTFRVNLLSFLLMLLEPLPTMRYLITEVEAYTLGHPLLARRKTTQNLMRECFAVATLIRTLSPTRQEIFNVRSQLPDFDFEFLDSAASHLSKLGLLP